MTRRELTLEEKGEAERLNAAWLAFRDRPEHSGATQTWLAAESGVGTQGAVGQYLRGVIPLNVDALVAICRVIEANPEEISPRLMKPVIDLMRLNRPGQDGKVPEQRHAYRRLSDALTSARVLAITDEEGHEQAAKIRRVKIKLSAGIAGFAVEPEPEDGNPIYFRKDWLSQRGYKAENLVATGVKGPSMETGLFDGDSVVFNKADVEPKDGEVFAVNYEGECVIKRLVRDAGQWWLSSDNPDQRRFPPKKLEGETSIILGRVIHKQSERI